MGYPKEVYNIVKNFYETHKFDAHNEREKRKREIYAKIPRILEIDKELNQLGLSLVGVSFSDTNLKDDVKKKRDKATSLILEKNTILKDNGYDEDYLSRHFRCSKCEDTGRVSDGYCECFNEALKTEAFKMANLPVMMDEKSFDTLKIDVYPENEREKMRDIFEISKDFADNFTNQNGRNLYMYGSPGLGKTYLSSCIAKKVIEKGYSVFYQPAYKIFRIFEDYKFNSENRQLNKSHIDRIMNQDLLIIDDLGAEMATTYTAEVLFDIVNTRLNNKQSTIINTNLDFVELETLYSERISSRILGGYDLMEFSGEDLR